jgi:oligopeptide/dipeptide ABC transporter ATP-binding protein
MSNVLEVRGLTTRFFTRRGAVQAVNDVSFNVPRRGITGIVGESGCGKSATIRSILGLVPSPGRVVAGEAFLEGRDLLSMPPGELRKVRGSSIGFVAQNPFGALNPVLKIRKQFHKVIAAHRDVSKEESLEIAREQLRRVGIPGVDRVLDGHAHELSGGMAQRVVIGMALSLDPRLVIADEPTTALDVTIQRQILDLIRELVLSEDRSMLLVTHDLGVVAQYCDEVVVMYAGKVVETGPVRDVFATPAHPYTQALLESVPRRGELLRALTGRVPDLIDYPTGCPYRFRCALADDRCAEEAPVPEALPLAPQRMASCLRDHEEVTANAARPR